MERRESLALKRGGLEASISAQVSTVRARVDCSFSNVVDGRVVAYSASRWRNVVELAPFWRSAVALSRALGARDAPHGSSSWRAWKTAAGLRDGDPAVRALDAQLSWVLSASLDTVDATPAAPILAYARGLIPDARLVGHVKEKARGWVARAVSAAEEDGGRDELL